jgi:AcrR family transcriptional regulator
VTDAVKGPLSGGSRRSQARETRRRIVAAAADLFVHEGYAATTLDRIAAASGVAVQTVYFHFGNKRTLLKQVVDVSSVGDDEPVPLLERPWAEQLRTATDGRAALAVWMAMSREIFVRVAPLLRIVRDAAGTDPEMAEQWRVNQEQRYEAHRALAQALAEKGGLRPGLSVDDAADALFALISIEVYVLLTEERGWPPERWERWALSTVGAAVLPPP